MVVFIDHIWFIWSKVFKQTIQSKGRSDADPEIENFQLRYWFLKCMSELNARLGQLIDRILISFNYEN